MALPVATIAKLTLQLAVAVAKKYRQDKKENNIEQIKKDPHGCLLITLVGCQMTATPPAKPVLTPKNIDGFTCFSTKDAANLGIYIVELEGALNGG